MDSRHDTERPLAWRPYGEHAALIELDSSAEVARLHRLALASGLAAEVVPGARTLLVAVEPPAGGRETTNRSAAVSSLVGRIEALRHDRPDDVEPRVVRVPVRYDGVDLAEVAARTGFSVDEVVLRHCAPLYTVAFVGFSRGFPYLVGLDPALDVPRRDTPRTSVPAGSVAIAADFTGIYPAASPGGWNVIGTTDLVLFDPEVEPPNAVSTGDRVRFVAVAS